MQNLDPAGEWLRLSEHYRQLGEGKLLRLARDTSQLTGMAQQILAQEMAHRGLKSPREKPAAPRAEWKPDSADADSPYAEDRKLVDICTVWSLADALKLQRLLDTAGIPFCIGLEKATSADAVTSNFAKGLTVQIMQVGWPWARRALKGYFPADEPPQEQVDESEEFAMHCPKCRSTEVVFEELDHGPDNAGESSPSKFKWACDSCGHQWEDDGLLTPESGG